MDFVKLTTVSHALHTDFSYFSFNQLFTTKSEMNMDGHNNVKMNTNNTNDHNDGKTNNNQVVINKGNQL